MLLQNTRHFLPYAKSKQIFVPNFHIQGVTVNELYSVIFQNFRLQIIQEILVVMCTELMCSVHKKCTRMNETYLKLLGVGQKDYK